MWKRDCWWQGPNKIIPLTDSVTAIEILRSTGARVRFLIDAEDTDKISSYHWYCHVGYACCTKYERQWPLTWELLGRPPKATYGIM